MASSDTDIVNGAMAFLGSYHRVQSMSDGSAVAVAARDIWPQAVRTVMVSHPWNFALTRIELKRDVTAPEGSQFLYRYRLPVDCLRWLPGAPDDIDYFDAEQEGEFLLADSEGPVTVRYISEVKEAGRWAAGFVDVLTMYLAWYLAEAAGSDKGTRDRALNAYEQSLARARRQDGLATGMRQRRSPYRSSRWLGAFGYRGGYSDR